MPSIAVISLFAFVPAFARPILQKPVQTPVAVNAYGKYASSFSANPFSKHPRGRPDEFDSRAPPVYQRQQSASSWSAPAPQSTGGLSAEQVAFMERQNSLRGGASSSSWDAPSRQTPTRVVAQSSMQSLTGSSSKKSGFAPEFAPALFPLYAGGMGDEQPVGRSMRPLTSDSRGVSPRAMAGVEGTGGLSADQKAFMERQQNARAGVWLDEQTSDAPDALSLLAAGAIGALVGAIGTVIFVMFFRRSAWSGMLKEPLMTVSN